MSDRERRLLALVALGKAKTRIAELETENARLRKIEVAAQIANNEIRRFGLSSSVEPRQELFDAGQELSAALALQPGEGPQ